MITSTHENTTRGESAWPDDRGPVASFHLMNPTDARMAAATFLDVFPHAALWMSQRTGILIGGIRRSRPTPP